MTDDPSPYDVFRRIEAVTEFVVRPEHIALLRSASSSWEGHAEVGAPSLSRRKPFGGSDIYADIAAIVDGRTEDDYGDADEPRYVQLYGELGLVLEIVLQAGSFEPGCYARTPAGGWQRAKQ